MWNEFEQKSLTYCSPFIGVAGRGLGEEGRWVGQPLPKAAESKEQEKLGFCPQQFLNN
jgi:hypothetical protein